MEERRPSMKANTRVEGEGGVRILLSSTRFIASLFWLTIVVATMVFVLPYSDRTQSPAFYAFVVLSLAVFFAHRYFPYEGYHPISFTLLLLATDALVATMVYLTGGSSSSLFLLYFAVIIFSSAYFELLETMLITAFTGLFYFLPMAYETLDFETVKNMAIAVPIFFIIALCGSFVISKAREQEREKKNISLLYDQADTKRRELSTLYAVSLKFASTLDRREIVDILMDNAYALVRTDAVVVSLLDEDGVLRVTGRLGLSPDAVDILERKNSANPLYVSASAVLPVVLRDRREDSRFEEFLLRTGFDSMMAVPLYASASVIGVVSCFSREEGSFDDDAARLLLTMASEAAVALEKASLYQTTLEDKGKIEAIINSLSDGLMVIDRHGRFVLANPSARRLLGLPREMEGMSLLRIMDGMQWTATKGSRGWESLLEEVLEKGESVEEEMTLLAEKPIYFQVSLVPLKDREGGTGGAVILLHDVTGFVELDRMKSEFISIVSHELKTPLTSIKGFVRLLTAQRVGPVNEKQRRYLDIVLRQTESLTALINDLLDLSKIEAGMLEVRRDAVELGELVEGVFLQLRNMAQEKGINLEADIPEHLPSLCGDAERLNQVFVNLVHNALKFTSSGGRVSVTARVDGDKCRIEVSDTGMGIPPSELPRIFDKFYQVDSSSTRKQSGTGLGLTITRRLVEAMDGRITVQSRQGEGTTFTMFLPLHEGRTLTRPEGDGRAFPREETA